MDDSRYLSSAEVGRFLAFAKPDLKEIVLELRNLVFSLCPHATERILWRGLSYHDAEKGGPVKGAICQIELDQDQVRISFIHGARLHDPEQLLGGERLSKKYLVVKSFEDAPWEAIGKLIEEASALKPSNFGGLP